MDSLSWKGGDVGEILKFEQKNICHIKPENDNSRPQEDDTGRRTTIQKDTHEMFKFNTLPALIIQPKSLDFTDVETYLS